MVIEIIDEVNKGRLLIDEFNGLTLEFKPFSEEIANQPMILSPDSLMELIEEFEKFAKEKGLKDKEIIRKNINGNNVIFRIYESPASPGVFNLKVSWVPPSKDYRNLDFKLEAVKKALKPAVSVV